MLALFLQGSSGGHMLLVEHARCVEHGELVHNGEAHHVAAEQSHAKSPAIHGTPDVGTEEAHDHCSVSADRRDALVSIADAQPSAQVTVAAADIAPLQAFVVAGTARFRVAPKNSPPA